MASNAYNPVDRNVLDDVNVLDDNTVVVGVGVHSDEAVDEPTQDACSGDGLYQCNNT